MIPALSLLALVAGATAIAADARGARRAHYAAKPLATLALVGVALAAQDVVSPAYRALVAGGLVFSLAGDVFLMLPRDRFLPGLASFLVAHLLYIAAFGSVEGFQRSGLALAPFAAFGGVLMAALLPHAGRLRLPVLLYAVAIGVMGWQALGLWLETGARFAGAACLGAALFSLSDASLAWARFRGRFPHAQAVVLSTYWAGQWLIARSVAG